MKAKRSHRIRSVLVLLSMALLLCWGAVALAEEELVPSPDATTCPHEYDWQYDEYGHWVACLYCGEWLDGMSESDPHGISCDDLTSTVCSICGATDIMEGYISHIITCEPINETQHQSACACGEIDEVSLHAIACDLPTWCIECGASDVEGEIRHEYANECSYNETHHWVECLICGEYLYGRSDLHFVDCDDPDSNVCLVCGAAGVEVHLAHSTTYESISETQHRETCACGEIDYISNHSASCIANDLTTCAWCYESGVVCQLSHWVLNEDAIEFNEKEHWFTCINCQEKIVEVHFRLEDGTCISCDVTGLPAATPTVAPTAEPTATPPAEPTLVPPLEPTVKPTAQPTAEPTVAPTAEPTAVPTTAPTAEPTAEPTVAPTAEPTAEPTIAPTAEPTTAPTAKPVTSPTTAPAPEAVAVPSINASDVDPFKSIELLESELREGILSADEYIRVRVPIELLKEVTDESTYEQITQLPVHEQIVVLLAVLNENDVEITISEEAKVIVENVVRSIDSLDTDSTAAFQQMLDAAFPKQEVAMGNKEYVCYLIPLYVTIDDVTQVKYYAFCLDKPTGKWMFTVIEEGMDVVETIEQAQ